MKDGEGLQGQSHCLKQSLTIPGGGFSGVPPGEADKGSMKKRHGLFRRASEGHRGVRLGDQWKLDGLNHRRGHLRKTRWDLKTMGVQRLACARGRARPAETREAGWERI